jgi:hypothetical protein
MSTISCHASLRQGPYGGICGMGRAAPAIALATNPVMMLNPVTTLSDSDPEPESRAIAGNLTAKWLAMHIQDVPDCNVTCCCSSIN